MDWRAKPEIVTRDGTPTGKKCISCGRIMGQACDCISRIYDDASAIHPPWCWLTQRGMQTG